MNECHKWAARETPGPCPIKILELGLELEQDFELHLKLKTCYCSCTRISLGQAQVSSLGTWTSSQAQESLWTGPRCRLYTLIFLLQYLRLGIIKF